MLAKLSLFACLFFTCTSGNVAHASVWEDFSSPVRYEDSQKVLLIGTSATLIASLFKSSFVKKFQRDIREDRPLCCTKPGNEFLQIYPNVVYALGFGINYYFNRDDESKRLGIGMVKATLYSGIVADVLKPLVGETRPNGGTHSFPSGHTTTAFAFASFVASEHPWYVGVPAYVMASYVGICRMQDNYHYLHDVLAGATIGMSYGIALSQSSKKDEDSKSAFFLAPTDELKGLAFRYNLQF